MIPIPAIDVSFAWFVPPVLATLVVGASVLIAQVTFGRTRRFAEVSRKVVHVVSGATFAIGASFMTKEQMMLTCAFLAAGLVASSALRLPLVMERVPRVTVGAAAFPLGLAMATALFYGDPDAFRFAVLALGVCDAVAALVGTYLPLGEFRVFGQRKSLSGFLGCTVAGFLLALVSGFDPLTALGAALAIAITESLFVFGLDNLFVPIVAGLLRSLV